MTGIAYVELSGGARNALPLRAIQGNPYPLIRTQPSLSARLENVLTTVLTKLDSTSNNLNALLSDENRTAFKNALADIATVSRTLAARQDSIDRGIRDAARTLENTAHASARAKALIDRVEQSADAITLMGQDISQTSKAVGRTVDAVGPDVKRFSAETLPALERLLGELSVLSTALRRLSEQTERNPSGILFGHKPVQEGPGESTTGAPQP